MSNRFNRQNITLHCYILTFFLLFIPGLYTDGFASETKVLRITGWDVYGSPKNADKTIGYESFERESGFTIEFTPQSNLDDIVSAAESGTEYDIFIISNEGIKLLHDMDLVSPLDLSEIPHYQDLHHNLKYSEWSQFDSRVYAVPWAWGPTGLLYNQDIVKDPVSWNTLWDPKYKGKIAMWDDVSMIWTAALSLGYKNVYSLTRIQLEKVKEKLLAFNKLSGNYYKGGGDELELARKGNLIVFNSWYDPSTRLKNAGKNFAMIIPKEGAVGMFDSYMISKQSNNTNAAYRYINHQIKPEIQKQMVRITGLAPASIESMALLSPQEIKSLHLDDPDYFNRMLLWDHMPRRNLYEQVLQAVREHHKKMGQ